MDNIDVWPYNTCFFSVTKAPRTSPPKMLGGLAAKIYSPNSKDCFDFVYYSGSNNGMNKFFSNDKKNKVGKINFSLLTNIGSCSVDNLFSTDEL